MTTTATRATEMRWSPIRNLEDVAEIERVPLQQQVAFTTTYELLQATADRLGDRPALTVMTRGTPCPDDITLSYRALLNTVTRTANLFHQLGQRRDEAVSILLPNIAEFQFALWGGEAVGRANPVNPLLDADAIRAILMAAKTKIVITLPPGHPSGLYERATAACPPGVTLAVVGASGARPLEEGVVDFDKALGDVRGDRLDFTLPSASDDIAALYHTGGTTGQLKLVTHSHRNEIANAWQSCCCFALTADDVVFNAAPLFHVTGTILLSLAPFLAGAHVVMGGPEGFRNAGTITAFWDIIARHRISVCCGVPTVYAALLSSPCDGKDISSLRFAICGAAPLPDSVAQSFFEKTGAFILEGYGMTETCSTSIANPRDGQRRLGSIGIRAPYQDVRIAILDEEGAFVRDADIDESGALLLRGPNVTPGYLPESINEHTRPLPDWLDTGDTARIDASGYVYLTGRKKDLIIRSGHNIDPALVENALAGHPAVAAVAAVGKPDGYAGELPVAYVVVKPGHEVTPSDLIVYARGHVAERPAAPGEVILVGALPLTAVGKVFKPTLRLDITRRACAELLAELPDMPVGEVQVSDHPMHGRLVSITLEGMPDASAAEAVRIALSPLALHHEIEWTRQKNKK